MIVNMRETIADFEVMIEQADTMIAQMQEKIDSCNRELISESRKMKFVNERREYLSKQLFEYIEEIINKITDEGCKIENSGND